MNKIKIKKKKAKKRKKKENNFIFFIQFKRFTFNSFFIYISFYYSKISMKNRKMFYFLIYNKKRYI